MNSFKRKALFAAVICGIGLACASVQAAPVKVTAEGAPVAYDVKAAPPIEFTFASVNPCFRVNLSETQGTVREADVFVQVGDNAPKRGKAGGHLTYAAEGVGTYRVKVWASGPTRTAVAFYSAKKNEGAFNKRTGVKAPDTCKTG